jgi:tRNA-splicing ligase RtcB
MIYGIDDGAVLAQFMKAIKEGYVHKSALMPDAHLGYSVPIGAVISTHNAVVPSWVGYDIGCGMLCAKLNVSLETVEKYKEELHSELVDRVPVKEHAHGKQYIESLNFSPLASRVYKERKGAKQLGTIGSGNHFIEIGSSGGEVFVTIHSGSRGFGHGVATEWMALASGTDKPKEGNYPLYESNISFTEYMRDMRDAANYALANRESLMEQVMDTMEIILGTPVFMKPLFLDCAYINCIHNYCSPEDGYYVHRKGATMAGLGEYGVIPGNMRDGVAVVRGKGNVESLKSCSHGAGRIYSRSQAKKVLSLETEEESMDHKGIVYCQGKADELPGAYKDFYEVLEAQEDLIDIVQIIEPLINVKG